MGAGDGRRVEYRAVPLFDHDTADGGDDVECGVVVDAHDVRPGRVVDLRGGTGAADARVVEQGVDAAAPEVSGGVDQLLCGTGLPDIGGNGHHPVPLQLRERPGAHIVGDEHGALGEEALDDRSPDAGGCPVTTATFPV
ncbi:hypothetical protein GCM10027162_25610 [Streptomyces incanus]